MPRKDQSRVTGVWEKVRDSSVWWIRYRVDGKLKREKVGRKGDAIALYQLRKSQTRAGKKLPANLRIAGVRFNELADAILTYSASHHRDTRNIKSRMKKILPEFGERVAEGIKPEEIDSWLTTHIQLSLLETGSPRWRLSVDRKGVPTLAPSVHRTRGCKSHFFPRAGRIDWYNW